MQFTTSSLVFLAATVTAQTTDILTPPTYPSAVFSGSPIASGEPILTSAPAYASPASASPSSSAAAAPTIESSPPSYPSEVASPVLSSASTPTPVAYSTPTPVVYSTPTPVAYNTSTPAEYSTPTSVAYSSANSALPVLSAPSLATAVPYGSSLPVYVSATGLPMLSSYGNVPNSATLVSTATLSATYSTKSNRASPYPTGKPETYPGGQPGTYPGGQPATYPTGQPSASVGPVLSFTDTTGAGQPATYPAGMGQSGAATAPGVPAASPYPGETGSGSSSTGGASPSGSASSSSGSGSSSSGSSGSGSSGSGSSGSGTSGSGSSSSGTGSSGSGSGSSGTGSSGSGSTGSSSSSGSTGSGSGSTGSGASGAGSACPPAVTNTVTATVTITVQGAATAAPAVSAPKAPYSNSTSSGTTSKSCPLELGSTYQYPHLLVTAKGNTATSATSYIANISSDITSYYNFDIPASYAGKTCDVVFALPTQSQLTTSSFTLAGSGALDFFSLSAPVTAGSAAPQEKAIGNWNPMTGYSYAFSSGPCAAGTTVGFAIAAEATRTLSYFQDYNACAIGLYVIAH